MGWGYYPPYVPVAQRRANALREVQKMARKGTEVSPVTIDGPTIASTFWGKAWCDNLESYSDFSNRLPRGRTYVRNGSVVDLQVEAGKVTSLVSGSRLYRITIQIRPLAAPCWKKLKTQCGSQIGSLVELLQGKLSKSVMEIVTHRQTGLFPAPKEIEMSCSCPDWAGMCKHIAATLYAIGNRLDREPELFFKLRQVDHLDLIAQAGIGGAKPKGAGKKRIAVNQLADVFGIELEYPEQNAGSVEPAKPARHRKSASIEETTSVPVVKTGPRAKKPPVPGSSANARSKPISVAARKRIAKAMKERGEALRQASRSTEKETALHKLAPARKAMRAKPAKAAVSRSS
jgi:uncharacterized Zn finger protein